MRHVTALVLAFALIGGVDLQAQIKTETSQFTDTKRLVSKSLRSLNSTDYPGHGSFRAEYEVRPKRDTTWRLSLFGFAKDTTRMSEASVVRFQADSSRFTSRRVSSSTRLLEARVVEVKHVILTRGDFEKLATAANVEATIGPFEFTLTRPQREDLRRITRRVPPPQETAPVASDDSASGQ